MLSTDLSSTTVCYNIRIHPDTKHGHHKQNPEVQAKMKSSRFEADNIIEIPKDVSDKEKLR